MPTFVRYLLVKAKITCLWKYYLLNDLDWLTNEDLTTSKQQAKREWLNHYLQKESYIIMKINSKLKTGWEFKQLPSLEKAILAYGTYEILFNHNLSKFKVAASFINQTVEFSKKYLELDKHKYINKILDLIHKKPYVDLIIYPVHTYCL